MILSWFDASEAKTFGNSLAIFFVERVPPTLQIADKAFAQKADKVLNKMTTQVVKFKHEHKLNAYKKAQLGNAFKWTLKDAGVSSEYVNKLTQWLMMHIG